MQLSQRIPYQVLQTRGNEEHWYMYPPKGMYQDCSIFPNSELSELSNSEISIYIHIPFCEMKCLFCSLFSTTGHTGDFEDRYIDAIVREIETSADDYRLASSKIVSVYVGGGTPSVLSKRNVQRLRKVLADNFDITKAACSVEVSPKTATQDVCDLWFAAGFQRASVGVQSFSQSITTAMNRNHSPEASISSIANLAAAGFTEINVDLIFGFAQQDATLLREDLHAVAESLATSCTYHPLSQTQKTPQEKKALTIEDGNLRSLHCVALEFFDRLGWLQTSAISSSKGKPKVTTQEVFESHNIPTIGFGAGARSYMPRFHGSTLPASRRVPYRQILDNYFLAVKERKKPIMSGTWISPEESARRSAILMLHNNILDLERLRICENSNIVEEIGEKIALLEREGFVAKRDSTYRLTHLGASEMGRLGTVLASVDVQSKITNPTESRF